MVILSLSDKQRKQGPLSKESVSLSQTIKEFGKTDSVTLRTRLHLIRSRFWKNISDLIDLNILSLNRKL
jgi:hypothetical protein